MKTADEFYIGWEAKTAPALGRRIRIVVIGLILTVATLAIGLAVAQRLVGISVFEWGTVKNFAGILKTQPYPHLLVPRPGNTVGLSQFSTYYLVAPWKFGLSTNVVAPLDGQSVSLKGTLIYRENQTMIEVKPDSIKPGAEPGKSAEKAAAIENQKSKFANSLPVTLIGEIVDSKCFLGVMNPGQLAPHRACAIRCISGGVPPVLLVRPKEGPLSYLLLVSAEGKPVNKKVLDVVAEPVQITGEIQRQGELLILRADPSSYRRL